LNDPQFIIYKAVPKLQFWNNFLRFIIEKLSKNGEYALRFKRRRGLIFLIEARFVL
jgi:hypothetical protein